MRFNALKETRTGRSLFILGSGPSLLDTDLALLQSCDVMALNHSVFFLDWNPTWWAFVDWRDEFKLFLPAALHRGIRVFMGMVFHPRPDHPFLIPVNICGTPGHCLYATADFALGIAAHLGYMNAYLIGFDRGEYKGSRHIVHPGVTDNYTWADMTIKNHQGMLRIAGTGAHCGIPFIPFVSLDEAIKEGENP